MSLRPSIYAANITGFRTALAGDRAALVKSAEAWFSQRVHRDKVDINRGIDMLLGGASAGKPELDQQVDLVAALANACGLDADSAMIHWGDWKIGAYYDYFYMLTPVLPESARTYCQFLGGGRAMFGTRIVTEWTYYSYLMADELSQLTADLAAAHARLPELDSPDCIHGFPTQFRGWLRQIQERNADLWLFAE